VSNSGNGSISRHPFEAVMLSMLLGVLGAACVPAPIAEVFVAADMRPPAVVSWGPSGPGELLIVFDEELSVAMPGFASSPGPVVESTALSGDSRGIVVRLDGAGQPGAAYAVSGIVADAEGNLSSFVLPYWGFNPDPPELKFNELLTEGSSTHPDAVEFYVTKGGGCAGLAFFTGVPGDHDLRYIFPQLEVETGDFIVLHLKPQNIPLEINETDDKAASGGLDADQEAWDLWYRGGDGALSGANGALSLCTSPNGGFMDAVLYSVRTVESDTKYGGFGTAVLRDRVGAIVTAGVWTASAPPRPEDCARSTGTTSTRTICRSSSSGDTDAGIDWHIVPTKGSTLGGHNVDDVYVP
jgi:hypothetical protein